MQSKVLSTPVDDLMEIVKKEDNSSISSLKQKLNVPQEILGRWLIVLEEYDVLKVHYKGFEGYVTISQKTKEKKNEDKINVEKLKEVFIEKGKKRNLSYDKMKQIWPIFVKEYENDIRDLFEDKAKDSGYDTNKIEKAWNKYKLELKEL